jgi:hypothetical protein
MKKNLSPKEIINLNRLAALLVVLWLLLVPSAKAQEDLFSNTPYVSHWETINGVARYGYWHEVHAGYEQEVGRWDYSAGNGHWEARYTGENTYDEEGSILSEPSYEEWVLDPDWVVTAEWVPGVLEWVDDFPPQDDPVCGCCESAEIAMREAENWMPDVANVMSDAEFGIFLHDFLDSNGQAALVNGIAAAEAYGFEDPQAGISAFQIAIIEAQIALYVSLGRVSEVTYRLEILQRRFTPQGRDLINETQKIWHVFFNKPQHNMIQFMGRIGLNPDQTRLALNKIQDAANANVARLAQAQGKCPNFSKQPLVVDGVAIEIGGSVQDGVVRLGTAYYNP